MDFVEALDHARPWFVRPYRDGYLAAVSRLPALAGWIYRATDRPISGPGVIARAIERVGMGPFAQLPALVAADVIVTTHFLCARVLVDLKHAGVIRTPLAVCVTDVHPHAAWLATGAKSQHVDVLLVASAHAVETAVRAGVCPSRVHQTGIPIDGRFAAPPSKAQARLELGLPPEHGPASRPVVVVAGGGLGLGGVEAVVRRLASAPVSVHVVALCGRNQALRRSLEPLASHWRSASPGRTSVAVEGFTCQMPSWLAAADLLIGKPGGLTSAEACAAATPMVLLKPIPGQEEYNARFLVEAGAAVAAASPDDAVSAAIELIEHPGRRAHMRDAARSIGRPNAAASAAKIVLSLLSSGVQASPCSAAKAPLVCSTERELACLPCVMG